MPTTNFMPSSLHLRYNKEQAHTSHQLMKLSLTGRTMIEGGVKGALIIIMLSTKKCCCCC